MEEEESNDIGMVFDSIASISTVALSLIAYLWTQYQQRYAEREARRKAFESAMKELDTDMFLRLTSSMFYIRPDKQIEALSTTHLARIYTSDWNEVAMHRLIRHDLRVFFQKLMPICCIIDEARKRGDLFDTHDPLVSSLRSCFKALHKLWTSFIINCNFSERTIADIRNFFKTLIENNHGEELWQVFKRVSRVVMVNDSVEWPGPWELVKTVPDSSKPTASPMLENL